MPNLPLSSCHCPALIASLQTSAHRIALGLFAFAVSFLVTGPATSILHATPNVATEQPFGGLGNYHYVGALNGASGTYLGDGWVLTANHVGAGNFFLDGVNYASVPGSSIRLETSPGLMADLLMFQVNPIPPNLSLPIRQTPPSPGTFAVMVGNGFEQGVPTSFDPYGPTVEPPLLYGWAWDTDKRVRWATNSVHNYPNLVILGTETFRTQFDNHSLEGQATTGDSGGAVFTYDTYAGFELAGIMLSVSAEWQQPYGTSLLTNQTIIASIDAYRDQILQNIAVPEPTGALPAGLLLLSLFAHDRRTKRARL